MHRPLQKHDLLGRGNNKCDEIIICLSVCASLTVSVSVGISASSGVC